MWRLAALILVALGVLGREAPAQAASGAGGVTASAVTIDVLTFGVGGVVRPGEWAGIRLVLTDSGTRPRGVAVRFHLRDDDGDTLLAERRVILNPGRQEGVWVYVRMPWRLSGSNVFTVTANEIVEGSESTEVGRQLGATRVRPSRVVDPTVDLMGVIGRRTLGLTQYENRSSLVGGPDGRLEISHEVVEVLAGLGPDGLPDSWEGLAAFGVLVWEEGRPSELGSDLKPEALREWIRRGGHLVVVLPTVGGEWFSGGNPLSDVLPRCVVRREEGVSLGAYRELLASEEFADVELPSDTTAHVFEIDPGLAPSEATALLDGPDGTVAARRVVDTGMVTVIGLDIGARALSRSALPRADRFWNRILGKRMETPSPQRIERDGREAFAASQFGSPHFADRYFNLQIAKSTAAGIGVLMALVVFIAYWVVSGPGGFGLLKLKGLERHSWVWFVGSVAVFALVAWIGANAIRETKISATHLTFVDHVYGQPLQHTTTWASVLLPSYGTETLLLGDPELGEERRQAMAVWSDSNGQAAAMSFPDARSYVVDVRGPQVMTVPSRATIKQFKLDWLGPRRWKMPTPVGAGWEPRVDARGSVAGRLTHELPGPIEGGFVLVNRGQLAPGDVDRRTQSALMFDATYRDLRAWAPGEVLDLSVEFAEGTRGIDALLERLVPKRNDALMLGAAPSAPNPSESELDYERLALYSLLQPPKYGETFSRTGKSLVRRRDGHAWDLSEWLTQPCVIIVGHVRVDEGAESATPLYVRRGSGWQAVPSSGWTVVRWVYLLEPSPPMFAYYPATPAGPAGAP